MLGPAGHLSFDPGLVQLGAQQPDHPLDVVLPRLPLGVEQLRDVPVGARVQVLERQVFQQPLHLPEAQAVGQRRVYVQRLLRDHDAPLLRQRVERSHIVEAVGQLDQHDADVLGHRHQHLADRRGVRQVVFRAALHGPRLRRVGQQLRLGQLGNAVYQGGHYAPELLLQHAVRYVAVLHHVVQQGGGEGVGVQVQVGQEQRGLQGMLDERLPGQPLLAVVSLLGETKGVLDHLHLVCG